MLSRIIKNLNKNYVLVTALFIILVIVGFLYPSRIGIEHEIKFICAKFIEQGIIYNGQPHCIDGPIFSLFTLLIKKLTNNPDRILGYIYDMLSFILLFIVILKIYREETSASPWHLLILYSFLIVIPSVFMQGSSSVLATLFFISGFYILFYTRYKYSPLFSAVFFSLALLTKTNTLVPIALSFAVYSVHNFKDKKNQLIAGAITFALIIAVFELIFPNMINYTILTMLKGVPFSLSGTLNMTTNYMFPNIGYYKYYSAFPYFPAAAVYTLALLVLIAFCFFLNDKRKPLNILTFATMLILFIGTLKNNSVILWWGFLYHFFPATALGIILIIKTSKNINNSFFKKSILLILLILLIFSSVKYAPSEIAFNNLKYTVEKPFEFLNLKPNLYILADEVGPEIINYFPPSTVFNIFPESERSGIYTIDRDKALILKNSGLLSGEWSNDLTNKSFQLRTKNLVGITRSVIDKKYDMIIIGPSATDSYLFQLLLIMGEGYDANQTNFNIKEVYSCSAGIGVLSNPCLGCNKFSKVIFKDWGECVKVREDIKNYYENKFDEICSVDGVAANAIFDGSEFFLNPLNKSVCQTKKTMLLFPRFSRSWPILYRKTDLLALIMLSALAVFYSYITSKKYKREVINNQ